MAIHVLYRTRKGGNDKPRPPWYSRPQCLLSLRRALRHATGAGTVTFVADGGMPPELLPLVRPDDRVVRITAGTAASSLRATVNVARTRARQCPDDFFWLCEDDYVYRPDAFTRLLDAVRDVPEADYFSLFTPRPSTWSTSHPSQPDRTFPELSDPPRLDGLEWRRLSGTTSTFGARGATLARDASLIRLGTMPGAPFDGATWHMLQGKPPYSWRHLYRDIDPYLTHRGLAKIIGKPAMRVVINVAAHRIGRHPRVLVVPHVNQAVHVELDEVEGSPEWRELSDSLRLDGDLQQ